MFLAGDNGGELMPGRMYAAGHAEIFVPFRFGRVYSSFRGPPSGFPETARPLPVAADRATPRGYETVR